MTKREQARSFSIAMTLLGLAGAIYSAVQWKLAASASSLKYEILFVMWLVLGIGWGSRLLPNGPCDAREAGKSALTK